MNKENDGGTVSKVDRVKF